MTVTVVKSGVTSTGLTIGSGSSAGLTMTVSAGGTIIDTTVDSEGLVRVYAGGTATGTTVNSNANFYVSGGTAIDSTVNSGGIMELMAETTPTASDITVFSGGNLEVLGGTASAVTVSSGGYARVWSTGMITDATIYTGGTEEVFSGGTVSDTTLLNGSTLDLVTATYVSGGTAVLDAATDVLTITEGGASYTESLVGDYEFATFSLTADPYNIGGGNNGTYVTVTMCFLAGTHIATPGGNVPVEALVAGDLVLTAEGPARPVRWLGRSLISTRFADRSRSAPIRIKAGALGEGLPLRDLLVSPSHALFLSADGVEGILVEANALVNDVSIVREANMPEYFTYYHVELATHELLLSEGVASESFVDNADRMNFQNWAEHVALPGDGMIPEMAYPRAKSARQIPAALQRSLAARAAAFGGVALSA